MSEHAIHLRDRTREVTLELPTESCVSLLAAVRDGTDSVEELLKEARYYDGTVGPQVVREHPPDAAGLTESRTAPFEVDLVEKKVTFPGDVIDFARRGVLSRRGDDGRLDPESWRTYEIGRSFQLYDGDRHLPIEGEVNLRNEKSLWSNALPPSLDDIRAWRLDGSDLAASNLREIHSWTQSAAESPPLIEDRSVYELRIEGSRRGTVEGRTHKDGPTRGSAGR